MQVVFATVDPVRDTPARMREYVDYFDEDFVPVSGELDDVLALTKALGIVAAFTANDEDPDAYVVDHTASMLLVDPERRGEGQVQRPARGRHDRRGLRRDPRGAELSESADASTDEAADARSGGTSGVPADGSDREAADGAANARENAPTTASTDERTGSVHVVMNERPTLVERLKAYALLPLPQHLLSRVVLWLTRRESSLTTPVVRRFAKAFDVDMRDAVEPDLAAYPTFNAFFTRALTPAARPRRERRPRDRLAGGRARLGARRRGRRARAAGQGHRLLAARAARRGRWGDRAARPGQLRDRLPLPARLPPAAHADRGNAPSADARAGAAVQRRAARGEEPRRAVHPQRARGHRVRHAGRADGAGAGRGPSTSRRSRRSGTGS